MAQWKNRSKLSPKTKQNGDKQSDAEFKTLVLRMLKEHNEDLNSIKKIQSETKDRLIEIKKQFMGKQQ